MKEMNQQWNRIIISKQLGRFKIKIRKMSEMNSLLEGVSIGNISKAELEAKLRDDLNQGPLEAKENAHKLYEKLA